MKQVAFVGIVLGLAAALCGCAATLAAGAVVEISNQTGDRNDDPLGAEIVGADGRPGWSTAAGRFETVHRMGAAAARLGCTARVEGDRVMTATCPSMPELAARRDGDTMLRLCAPGTDRVVCREAWYAVDSSMLNVSDADLARAGRAESAPGGGASF